MLAGLASAPLALAPGAAFAAPDDVPAAQDVRRGPSGLPLPRFVSLKSGKVNSRIGPGVNYAVDWMYLKSGLPMEIIQEYDNWRRSGPRISLQTVRLAMASSSRPASPIPTWAGSANAASRLAPRINP